MNSNTLATRILFTHFLLVGLCFGIYAHSWLIGVGAYCVTYCLAPYHPNQ